jgi:hypothetical protein
LTTVSVEPRSACVGTTTPEDCEVTMSAVALMPARRPLVIWVSSMVTG